MTQFNKGDVVKVTKLEGRDSMLGIAVGDVYTIMKVDRGTAYIKAPITIDYLLIDGLRHMKDSQLELAGRVTGIDPAMAQHLDWRNAPICPPIAISHISTDEAFGGYKSKPKTMLQKLSATLKRVLSAPMQSQYKAGIRNGDLALTSEGRVELLELLAAKYEKELTERAEAIITEYKEENK